jgi:hypothetical protein
MGFRFLDNSDATLFLVGKITDKYETVIMLEGEQIIGFKAKLYKNY